MKSHGLSDELIGIMVKDVVLAGTKAMEELLEKIVDDDVRRAIQLTSLETMLSMSLAYWYGDDFYGIRKSCRATMKSAEKTAIDISKWKMQHYDEDVR